MARVEQFRQSFIQTPGSFRIECRIITRERLDEMAIDRDLLQWREIASPDSTPAPDSQPAEHPTLDEDAMREHLKRNPVKESAQILRYWRQDERYRLERNDELFALAREAGGPPTIKVPTETLYIQSDSDRWYSHPGNRQARLFDTLQPVEDDRRARKGFDWMGVFLSNGRMIMLLEHLTINEAQRAGDRLYFQATSAFDIIRRVEGSYRPGEADALLDELVFFSTEKAGSLSVTTVRYEDWKDFGGWVRPARFTNRVSYFPPDAEPARREIEEKPPDLEFEGELIALEFNPDFAPDVFNYSPPSDFLVEYEDRTGGVQILSDPHMEEVQREVEEKARQRAAAAQAARKDRVASRLHDARSQGRWSGFLVYAGIGLLGISGIFWWRLRR